MTQSDRLWIIRARQNGGHISKDLKTITWNGNNMNNWHDIKNLSTADIKWHEMIEARINTAKKILEETKTNIQKQGGKNV